jgi:predicted RNase H-like HicB family nuclease
MKTRTFTASISQEGEMFIAQCLEIDVASQGKSEDDAIANLREALELYFDPPRPTVMPKLRKFEVSIDANATDEGEFSFLARLS